MRFTHSPSTTTKSDRAGVGGLHQLGRLLNYGTVKSKVLPEIPPGLVKKSFDSPKRGMRHACPVDWILWIVAIGVIATGLIAAIGGFSQLEDEDDFAGASEDHIPLQLFGYRRDVVDRLLAERQVANDPDA